MEKMNYVITCTKDQAKRIIDFYQDDRTTSNNASVIFHAKTKEYSVTIYSSFKVMFQGKEALKEYNMWLIMLDIEAPKETNKTVSIESKDYFIDSIGSDEVGTGDFFGPMVVCAAYVSKEAKQVIQSLGINDSKKINDDQIMKLGKKLKDLVPYSMLRLDNTKFNNLTKQGYNMNKLKAYLHNSAIRQLLNKLGKRPSIIVDQFAEPSLYYRYLKDENNVITNILFETKAESKYASVAVASIIARYAFLQYFEELKESCGYPLLKGASHKVDDLTAQILQEKGEDFLYSIAKVNFKTLDKAKTIVKEQE